MTLRLLEPMLQPFLQCIVSSSNQYTEPLTQKCCLLTTVVNRFYAKHKMCINFRDLSRIAKLNTQEFLEFVHHQNFICIEYQDLENTPN